MVICNAYYLEKRKGVKIEMKIAVCGKGGCGKSTVTSLLAKALARRGKEILVIDSDESNYGLHRQLGMKLPRDFTDYFGGKQNVLNDMMLSKFTHQFFEETWTIDDIPEDYYSLKDGVKLMTSGKIHQANEGCSCAFYSLVGFSGLFVIPVLVIVAPTFILCGVASAVLGIIKLVDYLLHLNIPYVDYIGFQFGNTALSPIPVFILSLITGIILFLLGRGAWKLLITYCKGISKTKNNLSI